jgi:hypothetical protein
MSHRSGRRPAAPAGTLPLSAPHQPPSRSRSPGRAGGLAVLALAAGLAAALGAGLAEPAAAAPYQDGDRVQFTGLVTDEGGKPLAGVRVVLEAARRSLSLREMRRTEKDARRVSALTNAQGEYALEWPWDSYFNRLRLLAGVDVRHGKEENLEVLEREDVSERVLAGSPVVSAFVIHNRAFVDRLREFVASVQSADERRIYEEMGLPDDVKRVNYAGRPQESEVAWWYFGAGRVYRFHNGRIEQVDRFTPVQRF